MIRHLTFYIAESAVLAAIALGGLALAANALRRLGVAAPRNAIRPFVIGWAAIALVDTLFTEWIGPEFVFLYHMTAWLVTSCVLLWLLTVTRVIRTGVREHSRHAPDEPSSSASEARVRT